MDPVSAAASIIAVIQITASVLSICNEYRQSVKSASSDAERINSELSSLKIVLEQVLVLARHEEQHHTGTTFSLARLTIAGGEVDICRENLTELQKKLQPREGWKGLKDTLTWHFKVEELNKILDRVRKSKETLNLAITVDSALVSLNIHEDVVSLSEATRTATLDATSQLALKWLNAARYSDKQNAARRKHQSTTGTWFIHGKQFADWRSKPNSRLWLHGIPGCGKTVLCSSVIESLDKHRRSTPNTALAFFYFDFNNTNEAILSKMLQTLIDQLATQHPSALALLVQEFQNHENGRLSPSLDVLSTLLTDMIKLYGDVYLALDALDECRERDDLLDWISGIAAENFQNLHILFSSRKEKDIEDVLKNIVDAQIPLKSSEVDPDIRLYLKTRLSNDRKLKKWPDDVKTEIEQSMMEKVDGMFRLAECQLDMLCKCNNIATLRKELQSLPRTLEATYTRILSEIDESHTHDALKVLQWLSFSSRPLLLREIVDILAIDTQTQTFNPDLRYTDPHDILTVCSSLISIHPRIIKKTRWSDRKERVEELRLAHFSVKEYLTSERMGQGPVGSFQLKEGPASASFAENCIIYLMQFREYNYLNQTNIVKYPFATYAAKYWAIHARKAADNAVRGPHQDLTVTFLSEPEICRNWISLWNPENDTLSESDWGHSDLSAPIHDKEIKTPFYYTCLYGLHDVTAKLLDNVGEAIDLDEIAGENGTILQAAALSGNDTLIRIILDRGANVNAIGGKWCTALQAAVEGQSLQVVNTLLEDYAADSNIRGGYYGSAIAAAAHKGNVSIVKTLLAHGADPNVQGGYGYFGTPLAAAASRGHEKIINLFLDCEFVKTLHARGADLNMRNHYGGTPLLSAVMGSQFETVMYLLENGCDPNISDSLFGTPLSQSAESGRLEEVRALLDYGALINHRTGSTDTGESPLAEAARNGHEAVVELLLSRGADVKGSVALVAAMKQGNLNIAQKLLDVGADIHEFDSENSTPLHAAASRDNLKGLEFLIERGANPHIIGGLYGTVLQAVGSSEKNKLAMIKYLLSKGVDPNVKAGVWGSALLYAARDSNDDPAIIRHMIDRGGDVNLMHNEEATLLYAAAQEGRIKICKQLLKLGAFIDARNHRGSALYSAIRGDQKSTATFLIQRNALVNSRNEKNDLHEAAEQGFDSIVTSMLELGADINGFHELSGTTALGAAASQGRASTIELLLSKGADPNLVGGDGISPVHKAAASESLRSLRLLVEAGGDIHAVDSEGSTVLQVAAATGEFTNVQYLLKLGADVNIETGPLHSAIQAGAYSGDRNVVKALLNAGANVNSSGGEWGNALQAAAQVFDETDAAVMLLLAAGADVHQKGGKHGYPIIAAASANNFEMVKTFVDVYGADVNAVGGEYGTALLAAASGGYADIVNFLLDKGANCHISGPTGTALYCAAQGGDDTITGKFLDRGVDIDSGWGEHGSALSRAIDGSAIKVFDLLLKNGVNVKEECGADGNAFVQAIRHADEQYARRLLELGVDVNVLLPRKYIWKSDQLSDKKEDLSTKKRTNDIESGETIKIEMDKASPESTNLISNDLTTSDNSDVANKGSPEDLKYEQNSEAGPISETLYTNALYEVLYDGGTETIKQVLLSKTVDINAHVGEYGSVLAAALVKCHVGVVKQILNRGGDPTRNAGPFGTILSTAASTGDIAKVKMILACNPDINATGSKWNSALGTACDGGYADVVKCLLENGADINIRGGKDYTCPLQIACHRGHFSVAKLLIYNGADVNLYDEDLGDSFQAAAAGGHFEIVKLLKRHRAIGDRSSRRYVNALQASTDGGYMNVIRLLIEGYSCFRKGQIFEDAVNSLSEGRHFNMAEKMRSTARETREWDLDALWELTWKKAPEKELE